MSTFVLVFTIAGAVIAVLVLLYLFVLPSHLTSTKRENMTHFLEEQ